MLTPDQIKFLLWLDSQPQGADLATMQINHAPGYSRHRVETMTKNGLIDRSGSGVYTVSDKGKAALLEHEQHRQEASEKAAQNDREHHFQIKLTLIGAVATGFLSALFSLLFQQLSELIRALIKQG